MKAPNSKGVCFFTNFPKPHVLQVTVESNYKTTWNMIFVLLFSLSKRSIVLHFWLPRPALFKKVPKVAFLFNCVYLIYWINLSLVIAATSPKKTNGSCNLVDDLISTSGESEMRLFQLFLSFYQPLQSFLFFFYFSFVQKISDYDISTSWKYKEKKSR